VRTESQIRIVIKRDLRWVVLLLAVVLAFLVFRWQVVEVFHIPSPSMEPALNGHPDSGDKVLVNKLSFRIALPQRWQVVVFERPGDAEPYIKRLVGLPGEDVRIEDGDVLVDGDVPPRSDAVMREMLIGVFRTPATPVDVQKTWEIEGAPWTVEKDGIVLGGGKGVAASLRTRQDVTDSWVDSEGAEIEGLSPVNDLVVAFEAEFLSEGGTIRAAIHRGAAEAVWIELDPSGALRLRRGDALLDAFEPRTTGFLPGEPFSVELWTVDRRVRVVANGVELVRRRDEDESRARAGFRRRNNRVTFTLDEARVRFRRLELLRDIYYTADGEEGIARDVKLGPDEYYLLGDHSRVSKDSRYWSSAVRREQLVGTAFMIVWPPGRIRMLP